MVACIASVSVGFRGEELPREKRGGGGGGRRFDTRSDTHFTLPGHSLNNLELIPLELINSNRDAIRKAREAFLIYKGKTLEPSGMNRRDEI